MQIIIDIPEKNYKMTCDGLAYKSDKVLSEAFKKAFILPQNHGKIIDMDTITKVEIEDSVHHVSWTKGSEIDLNIEALVLLDKTY